MADEPKTFDDFEGLAKPKRAPIPALFATIHFKSPQRPDGYTDADIAELNRLANQHNDAQDDDPGGKPDQA